MLPVVLGVGTIAIFGYLFYRDPYFTRNAVHTANISRSMVASFVDEEYTHWWDQIDDYLFLSAIPLNTLGHLNNLEDLKIKSVLSLIEDYERIPGYSIEPVQIEDYKDKNIDNLTINVPDYMPPTISQLITAIKYIHKNVSDKRRILVHCKVGKGRSVTTVACYLLRYGTSDGLTFSSTEDVLSFLKEKRPIIKLNDIQINRIREYENHRINQFLNHYMPQYCEHCCQPPI